MRGVALIGAGRPRAVATHERVLRLRAGTVGPALRVTAEASERVGSARASLVNATRVRRVVRRAALLRAASPAVLRPEQVAEHLVADDEQRIVAGPVGIE